MHQNVANAAAARIGQRAGKMSQLRVVLCQQGKLHREKKESRTKKSSVHFVLHSLTRGSLKVVLHLGRTHRLQTSPVSWLGGVAGLQPSRKESSGFRNFLKCTTCRVTFNRLEHF